MSDQQFFTYFSAEELSDIQAIAMRERIAIAEKDRPILGSDYFFVGFVGAEKLA